MLLFVYSDRKKFKIKLMKTKLREKNISNKVLAET